MTTLALYTTIYPGVEGFLPDFYRSVQGQTDQDFRLWIGLDALTVDTAERAMRARPAAEWVSAEPGETPAQVRQRALQQIVRDHEEVVLADSDDVMHPSRVAAARAALDEAEVAGCALRLVAEDGRDLHTVMRTPDGLDPADILPRCNIYGLSNSAYRSTVLERCLPIPTAEALVDWFLATRAWLLGAIFTFDPVPRTDYRQHSSNTARVRPPFTPQQVRRDAALVRRHFEILGSAPALEALPQRLALVEQVAAEVETFCKQVVAEEERLEAYVRAFNKMAPETLWWSTVAHPALRYLWTDSKEQR
jgi:hypothetical protein